MRRPELRIRPRYNPHTFFVIRDWENADTQTFLYEFLDDNDNGNMTASFEGDNAIFENGMTFYDDEYGIDITYRSRCTTIAR